MIRKNNIMPDLCNPRSRFHFRTGLNLLAGMGVDLNKIHIKAVGTYENYKGEIRSQDPEPGTPLTETTKIILEIGCSSAVDYMPYQFFYGLRGIRDTDSTWEEEARNLLAPYDASVIRHKAMTRFQTLKYDLGIVDREHLDRILKLFRFDLSEEIIDAESVVFWLSILPGIYFWGGNPDYLVNILKKVFGYSFRITENVKAECEIPKGLRYNLGSKAGRLGFETILGKSFNEYDSSYRVDIGIVPEKDIRALMPGGKIRRRIEAIMAYCMPAELDYQIIIRADRNTLTNEKNYLGYSTYI